VPEGSWVNVPAQYTAPWSYEYDERRNEFIVTANGHVVASAEDSEVAHAICMARNKEPAAPVAAWSEAFENGWIACSRWANRDDLIADIGSPAYIRERDHMLSARTAHPEPAAAEPVASRCPDCRGSGWLQEGVNAMVTRQIECRRCKGKGLIYTSPPSASAPSQPSEGPARVTEQDLTSLVEEIRATAIDLDNLGAHVSAGAYRVCANKIVELQNAALAAAEGKA